MTIIRSKTKASGGVTDQELAKMKIHSQKWIDNAMKTDHIDKDAITDAIHQLYRVSGLEEPVVVIVPSPLVMKYAYGAAAAIWYNKSYNIDDATRRATYNATDDSTRRATRVATYNATYEATRRATYRATYDATYDATDDATRRATRRATDAATDDATRDATRRATLAAIYDATYRATYRATDDATDVATDRVTYVTTHAATYRATGVATGVATDDATYDATRRATHAATYVATDRATDRATYDATDVATDDDVSDAIYRATFDACYAMTGQFGIDCANKWHISHQGGNMWSSYDCYITAMRDIIGLDLPEFESYKYWEQAAIHGGFRVMHEKFCIVSDFPEILKVDDQNQPHCENGPSHRWRDGWELYHWHGTVVPKEWILDTPDVKDVFNTSDIEVRAAGFEILGWANLLDHLDAKLIDKDDDPLIGELYSVKLPDLEGEHLIVKYTCPRNGIMGQPVPPRNHLNDEPIDTILGAKAWLAESTLAEYIPPEIRT